MELAEPALRRARGLPGMEQRLGSSARTRGSTPSARVDLLDGPLRLGEAAVDDAGDVPVLLRQIGADVAVDARDLEQRDVVLARVGVAAGGLEQRGVDDGAERGRLGGERLRQPQVALGDERRRVRLGVAGSRRARPRPAGADAARGVSRPNIASRRGSVNGISGSLKRATSSIRSTSRVTSRARQVGTRKPVFSWLEADPAEDLALLLRGHLEPHAARSRAPAAAGSRPASAGRPARPSAPVQRAPASSTISCVASVAAGPARCGSTPFSQRFEPSVRSACRSELRRIPTGSKFAASSRTFVVELGDLGLLAAHDPGERDRALGVGDHEILGARACARRRRASAPSRPSRARRATSPPWSSVEVVGVQRAAEREHHVVRHVDDVRDRADAGVPQARLQPQRRLADRDVAEERGR